MVKKLGAALMAVSVASLWAGLPPPEPEGPEADKVTREEVAQKKQKPFWQSFFGAFKKKAFEKTVQELLRAKEFDMVIERITHGPKLNEQEWGYAVVSAAYWGHKQLLDVLLEIHARSPERFPLDIRDNMPLTMAMEQGNRFVVLKLAPLLIQEGKLFEKEGLTSVSLLHKVLMFLEQTGGFPPFFLRTLKNLAERVFGQERDALFNEFLVRWERLSLRKWDEYYRRLQKLGTISMDSLRTILDDLQLKRTTIKLYEEVVKINHMFRLKMIADYLGRKMRQAIKKELSNGPRLPAVKR